MPSKNNGGIYVIDLGDVRQFLFEKLKREDEKIPDKHFVTAGALVVDAADRLLTSQMHWTRNTQECMDEQLIDEYWHILKNYPSTELDFLIDDVVEMILERFKNVIDLPTWKIITTQRRNMSIILEVGEDFRIRDWMKTRYRDFKRGRI